MLPFNPSSELARAANPELDLVGGYQHRSEADSSQFLISAETGIVHLAGLGRLGVSCTTSPQLLIVRRKSMLHNGMGQSRKHEEIFYFYFGCGGGTRRNCDWNCG